jgi:signal transduction histidine kinase/CheY-like chemotaxis protein
LKRWHHIVLFCMLLLSAFHVHAQAPFAKFELPGGNEAVLLRPSIKMVAETPQTPSQASASLPWSPQQAFQAAFNGPVLPMDFKGIPYRSDLPHWGVTRIHRTGGSADWIVYYRLATLENVQAFARTGGGEWAALEPIHASERLFTGYHYPSYALSLPQGVDVDIAIRVQTRAPIRMPIWVAPSYGFFDAQRADLVLAGLSLAVPLVVLFYLALLIPRSASVGLGWFIAMIILETIGAMWVSGHGHVLFPFIARDVWPVLGRLAYTGMVVVGWVHAQMFVGSQYIARPVRWGGWLIVSFICIASFLELFQILNTRDAFTFGVLFFPCYVMGICLFGWKKGVPYAGVYALAWSAFVASAVISVLGLVGWAFVSRWNVYYAQSSVAAILFGLVAIGHVRSREKALLAAQQQSFTLNETLALRQRFFAATNHDLRQPLQALGIYLDLMRAEVRSSALAVGHMGSYLADAKASFSNVTHFMDSFLDMARLDAKLLSPRLMNVGIGSLVERLAREHRLLAGRVGLELRCRPSAAIARTDPRLFERIVRNLLVNAIRYTRSGGVLLAVRRRGQFWRIDVFDTGPGLANKDQDRLFQAYSPLSAPESGQSAGLGLGLYISQQLALAMGHRIEVSSRVGRGSRFSLIVKAALTEDTVSSVPESEFSGALNGLHIALLEDERDVSNALTAALQSAGARVTQGMPDSGGMPANLLLADYQLGSLGMLTEQLPAIRRGFTGPIVVLTGSGDEGALRGLSEAKVAAVLIKPVALQTLVDAILAHATK